MGVLERVKQKVGERVGALFEERIRKGLETYGMTLDDNHATFPERIQHALEEALDLVQYLEWARGQAVLEELWAVEKLEEALESSIAVVNTLAAMREGPLLV